MKNKPKLTQMFIDLGQKSFGKYGTCKICSFLYLIGDLDDEKKHQKHCYEVKYY
jgi:hypothetical protein